MNFRISLSTKHTAIILIRIGINLWAIVGPDGWVCQWDCRLARLHAPMCHKLYWHRLYCSFLCYVAIIPELKPQLDWLRWCLKFDSKWGVVYTLGRNSHEEMTSQLRGLWARPCSGSGQPASVSLSLTSGQAVNKTRPCRPAIKGLSIPHGPYAPATGSQNCRGLGVIRVL